MTRRIPRDYNSNMRSYFIAAIVVSVGILVGGTSACSSSQPDPGLPAMWKAQFDQALADPTLSDFQHQVLSDYTVTTAEYQESEDRYSQCMTDSGFNVTFYHNGDGSNNSEGGYAIEPVPGTSSDTQKTAAADGQCQMGTIRYVMALYLGVKENPQGETLAQQVRACLQAHNLTDADGMSDDQFQQELTTGSFRATTPAGVLCRWDPTGSLGYTEEQAESLDEQEASSDHTSMTTNPDGSVVLTLPDGTTQTFAPGPDGTTKVTMPDGSVVTVEPPKTCPGGAAIC